MRPEVTHAGHPSLPDLPVGLLDIEWMPLVAARRWVAIRRDRRIHTRPEEVRVFANVGLRTVWLGGKKDMRADEQFELVQRHWGRIEQRREEFGAGPWSITLRAAASSPTSGVRPPRPERASLGRTAAGLPVLVVEDLPRSPFDPPTCLAEKRDVKKCAIPYNREVPSRE